MTNSVRIVDVSPRDGLQNETQIISTDKKIALIEKLIDAGVQDIEVTSLVSPTWIPQLADAEDILRQIPSFRQRAKDLGREKSPNFWALIPNRKGMERALNVGISHVATFMSASETHNRKNLNRTQDESLENIRVVTQMAVDEGASVRAYLSTVFGCPYEGKVGVQRSVEIVQRLLDMGIAEISLGDTTGMGDPALVQNVLQALQDASVPMDVIALHMHDTQGTALANVLMGYQMGIRSFDASTAGLGGCPYAQGASGNLATEDVVNMFHKMGCTTGIDLQKSCEVGAFLANTLQKELPGRYHKFFMGSCNTSTRTTA